MHATCEGRTTHEPRELPAGDPATPKHSKTIRGRGGDAGRDRPGAAARLHERLCAASLATGEVVLLLEGDARRGRPACQEGHVRTLHAAGSGDDAIVEEVCRQVAVGDGRAVVVVTADRLLRGRVEQAGGTCRGPGWLLDQL